MIQLIFIIAFVILVILMPKNNKSEKEAAKIFMERYNIHTKIKGNVIKQLELIEIEANTLVYRTYRKRFLKQSLFSFLGLLVLGAVVIGAMFVMQDFTIGIIGLIVFLLALIVYLIFISIKMITLQTSIRTRAWIAVVQHYDPAIPIAIFNESKWQVAFLNYLQKTNMPEEII
ncbi:Uncharacterised protein [Listeria grayi]|uniref:Uncharacterized protein n=1 Tax=Listeria grayi FSL F6-1183 TaxID=1265827 RepID=A0A829R930_LISGR|nr:hypothetical protein [Listeria grayi]EUJ28624.1 hypothetical protein LMUR_05997 [Listeria grayi FSL F6-1183]VEI30243.1 Uncharacterised protein [Listeria grayi]